MSRCATHKHLKEVHFKITLAKTIPFSQRDRFAEGQEFIYYSFLNGMRKPRKIAGEAAACTFSAN